jgi:hypothetical protein
MGSARTISLASRKEDPPMSTRGRFSDRTDLTLKNYLKLRKGENFTLMAASITVLERLKM